VKGEGLTGTITSSDESSAVEGETITPPSGASTPPTSTSVSGGENAAKPTELELATVKKTKSNKRKRGNEQDAVASKKSKKKQGDAGIPVADAEAAPTTKKTKAEKRLGKTFKEQQKQERQLAAKEEKRLDRERRAGGKLAATHPDFAKGNEAVIMSKLAKLSPDEKVEYEKRAAEKDQTLKEYVLRRIEKKAAKGAAKKERLNLPISSSST
jgi:hypothetical protein